MNGKPTFEELCTEIGQLVDEKNITYGSSVDKCGDFLRLLYPRGIPPQKMDQVQLLVRIFDKQMRIATDEDALGESPFADIAGYGLLGARMHGEKRGTWQGSVNGPDAPASPKAQPASAGQPTRQPTTTNASEQAAPPPSPPPASSSPQPTDATAATAAASAHESGDVRVAKVKRERIWQLILGFLYRRYPNRLDLVETLGCLRAYGQDVDLSYLSKEAAHLAEIGHLKIEGNVSLGVALLKITAKGRDFLMFIPGGGR